MSAVANLMVGLTLDPVPVGAGGALRHFVLVRNAGPGPAGGVEFRLSLPVGSGPVTGMPDGCTATATTVTCAVGDLDAGQQTVRVIEARAPTTLGAVIAEVTVGSDSDDPYDGDDSARATALVVGADSADLSLEMTGPGVAFVGAEMEFELRARNLGPEVADASTRVVYFVPSNAAFVSASAGCQRVNDIVTCAMPGLAPGEERVVSVTVRAPTRQAHVLSTASILGEPGNDTRLDNNTDTVTTWVELEPPTADLFVQKLGPATAQSGRQATYNLVVHNNGPDAAESVRVTDLLPNGVSVASLPEECTASGPVVTCDLGRMEPFGTTRQISLVATLPTEPGPVTNHAEVRDLGGPVDPFPANDSSLVTTNVTAEPPPSGADLAMSKAGPALVRPGAGFSYSLVVTNNGPDDATGVVVTDPLPAGVEVESVSDGCTRSGETVTCAASSLGAGEAAAFKIDVTAPDDEGELVNTAQVSSGTLDAVPGNDSATVTTLVSATAPVAPTLRFAVHPGAEAKTSARAGEAGVTALRFTAEASGDEVVAVTTLLLSVDGEGGAASIESVRLYYDADDDGVPEDGPLATGEFQEGTSTLVLTLADTHGSTVPAGGTNGYLVMVDLAPSAAERAAALAALAAVALAPFGAVRRRRGGTAVLVALALALGLAACVAQRPPVDTEETYRLVLEDAQAFGLQSGLTAQVTGLPLAGAELEVAE